MPIENNKRICLYSKEEFQPTRNNQIFATKANRVAYHNDLNNEFRRKLSDINKELTQNYKILINVLDNKESVIVHEEFLKGTGFSFKNFTHLKEDSEGYAYGIYECYYLKIDKENYKIIKT